MNALFLGKPLPPPSALLRECCHREPALTVFALLMLVSMLPAAIALALDARELRGVDVWIKPLKFMAALSLFSASTAWFVGLLPEARRRGGVVRAIVVTIIVAASFEIAYITLQAALGQASHYNFSDRLHVRLYQAMGAGALLMCVTQAVLAVQISRHGRSDLAPAWRMAVVRGLWLTLILGAGAGAVLSNVQAPDGVGLPVTGWHRAGDLRPAHFVGMHAQQFLPLLGLALMPLPAAQARRAINAFTAAYVLLWLGLLWMGLQDAHFKVPVPAA